MKFSKILLVFCLLLFFVSCREDVVEFQNPEGTADIYVNSIPRGAVIFMNDFRTDKVTPDSLVNVQPGSYVISVRLTGVGEESAVVNVQSGQKRYINITFH